MDTGHAKNVANLETAIIILNGLGAEYAPSQTLIQMPTLQTLLTEAKLTLTEVDAAQAAKTNAVDAVQSEFEDLDKYARNIKNNAAIELNDSAFTEDLQNIVNKFAPPGRDTGKPDDPATPDIDESRTAQSQSQRSRDNQIAHLADISALLTSRIDYKTNETEYKTGTINAKIASLTSANNAATAAIAALGNKTDARDEILYDEATGIVPRMKLVKTYVALKLGKDSAAYQQINALEFREVKP